MDLFKNVFFLFIAFLFIQIATTIAIAKFEEKESNIEKNQWINVQNQYKKMNQIGEKIQS